MEHLVRLVAAAARTTSVGYSLEDLRRRCAHDRLCEAVVGHNTPALFDWLIDAFSYQGISDERARRYAEEHGSISFLDIDASLRLPPSCPRLKSYWHFAECGYGKATRSCGEPAHFSCCSLPTHDLRNGRLNQTAYALFLFIGDICQGDFVGWVDDRLARADDPMRPDRAVHMRDALLEPLGCIHGVGNKVLSMALATLLLGADPDRERWVTTGASMIAVDTLVHNLLHRTGCLRRLNAQHAYGPACYRSGGCASIIEEAARYIDAREFCPDGPALCSFVGLQNQQGPEAGPWGVASRDGACAGHSRILRRSRCAITAATTLSA